MSALIIRDARPGDEETIYRFFWDFAIFEKLTDTFRLTCEIIARDFFGEHRRVQCEIAEWEGQIAGVMVWFRNYGTFAGAPIFYLEDIYVAPGFRRRGIGTEFFKQLARRAAAENAIRIDWIVLHWNAVAIDFYSRVGAQLVDEWRICRLEQGTLMALAKG